MRSHLAQRRKAATKTSPWDITDTDTLYIEFRAGDMTESRDLDENSILDLDVAGSVCGVTLEHASKRTDLNQVTLDGIAA